MAVKLPGLTEELKRRPVFDVNSLLGEAQTGNQARIVEVSHDSVGEGFSDLGKEGGHGHLANSPSAASEREHTHQPVPEDPINPSHYRRHPSGVECIEVTRHCNFNVGNAIKYLWRYMDKGDPVENLKKAQWYIDDEIRRLERKR